MPIFRRVFGACSVCRLFPPGTGCSWGIYCTGDGYIRKRDKCVEMGEPYRKWSSLPPPGLSTHAVATDCVVCQQLFVTWWTMRAEPDCCPSVHTDARLALLKVWHTIHNTIKYLFQWSVSCHVIYYKNLLLVTSMAPSGVKFVEVVK